MDYDVIVAGGGIAGSTAARFLAEAGRKTLFVERHKTPRNKPCSGIQFSYFEKILGVTIPKERLCNIELTKVKMYLPDGSKFGSNFKMFNFMRKPFDDWLNIIAVESGAEFIDDCMCQSIEEKGDHLVVNFLKPKEKKEFNFTTKYLIDATGLRPKIRNQLRPEDFSGEYSGGTLNYYIDGEADLDPETLYQFWNLEWNNAMFAWIYIKTLDDGKDYWVVGTGGHNINVQEYQDVFYKAMKEKFSINGNIVKKEGFKTSMDMQSKNRIWLGQNRVLIAGDAAGLVDPVRGVGMDAAALSGRLAAKAIINAEKKGTDVLKLYTKYMKRLTAQTIKNQQKEIGQFETNEELNKHVKSSLLKTGLTMMYQTTMNKIRSPEKQVMIP